jgi:hypothetical protein
MNVGRSVMKLVIPSAGGGEEEGLNDPGVELFLGSIEQNLARECAQNAIDAAANPSAAVELTFDLLTVPRSEIPCVDELASVLERCHEFWVQDKRSNEFFSRGAEVIAQPGIQVLHISDRMTTGLTGGDSDRAGRWYGLVRSAGVSNKGEGSGGSFGIGKFATFAASELRTVFYSTQTVGGNVAFQGILRLASHKDDGVQTTRRTGYVGEAGAGGLCSAIRKSDLIPTRFEKKEPGTDIFIVAYRVNDGWERRLVSSILTNFWPAIHRNVISFRVGGRQISAATLDSDLKEFSVETDFDAHIFYRCLIEGQKNETNIPNLGPVSLYLLSSDEDLPKCVALTRKTGMIIAQKQFRSRRPFCGYLICESPEGNELLRSLEPPRHDEWNPSRGTKQAAKALKDLYDWIRERIKELNPVPTDQALDVPDLARYLPFDEEADQPASGASGPKADNEFTPKTPVRDIDIRPTAITPPRVLEATNEGGDDDDTAGTGPGDGGAGGGEGKASTDGEGIGTGQGGGQGHNPSRSPSKKPKLSFRSFLRADGSYEVVLRTVAGTAKGFQLMSVGEDGRTEVPRIKSVREADSSRVVSIGGGASVLDTLGSKRSKRFIIELDTQLRVALAAEAL